MSIRASDVKNNLPIANPLATDECEIFITPTPYVRIQVSVRVFKHLGLATALTLIHDCTDVFLKKLSSKTLSITVNVPQLCIIF